MEVREAMYYSISFVQTERKVIPYFPEDADPSIGPYALRWMNYKAHYYTRG